MIDPLLKPSYTVGVKNRTHILILVVFIFVTGSLNSFLARADTCGNNLNTKKMSSIWDRTLRQEPKKESVRLLIFPFQDGSVDEPDTVLESAFSLALYENLLASQKIGLYHPFVATHALDAKGLTSADYFNDDKLFAIAKEVGATHFIYGLFQKQGSFIRFFVKVGDVDKNQVVGPIQEYRAEQTDRFFSILFDVADHNLHLIAHKKYKPEVLDELKKTPPGYEAFRYYSLGMQKSAYYNEVDLGVAKVWFEKAVSLSYPYEGSYREMARALFMQATLKKAHGEDSSLLWQEGQQALKQGELVSHRDIGNSNAVMQPQRWFKSNLLFGMGITKMRSGSTEEAKQAFKEALDLIPEDGVTLHYYNRLSSSSDREQLIKEIGACTPTL